MPAGSLAVLGMCQGLGILGKNSSILGCVCRVPVTTVGQKVVFPSSSFEWLHFAFGQPVCIGVHTDVAILERQIYGCV